MARPRLIDIACPRCGGEMMVCRHTRKQESLIVRYYRCKKCWRRIVFISTGTHSWKCDPERRQD